MVNPTNRSLTGVSGNRSNVLALIPALNEADSIGPIIEEVAARLPTLVIDDGSVDGTSELARSAGAEVIRHPQNLGKGAALRTGFAWAMQRGFRAVLTLDADGQHDPQDMVKLLAAADDRRGSLVIGERTFSEMPWPRWWCAPLGAWLLSRALGKRMTDNQSGFRLIPRSFMESMRPSVDGYEMEVEMIGEAVRLGTPIVWVPIRTIYPERRKAGFRPLLDTLRFLRMVGLLWRRRRRWERSGPPVRRTATSDEG